MIRQKVWQYKWLALATVVVLWIAPYFIGVFERFYTYPRAILWHCMHGNYIYLDQHRMKLPLLWWKDGDQYSHFPTYKRASLSGGFPPTITLMYLQPDSRSKSADELVQRQQRAVSYRNSSLLNKTSQTSLLEIKTRWTSLHCMDVPMAFNAKGSSFALDWKTILCDAPGLDSSISYSGPTHEYQEARSIFESFE